MKKSLLLVALLMLSSTVSAKDAVVATVNGASIYESSVATISSKIPVKDVEKLGGKDEVRKTIIKQLASAEALKQASLTSGIDKTDEFKEIMKLEKEKILQEEYLRIAVEKRVSESQIKDAYEQGIKKFKPQVMYNLSNILSATEEDAKNIVKELNNGANFEDLAVKKSKSSNVKETKGNIGFVKKAELVDEIEKNIDTLKKGEYSKKPIKTPFGWNVFLLKDKKNEPTPKYEESKILIQKALYKKEMMKILGELYDSADVELK